MQHVSEHNPMGTRNFSFLEFTAENPEAIENTLTQLGFQKTAKHKSKAIHLWQQNEIIFLVHHHGNQQAEEFTKIHGPSASSLGFLVENAQHAFEETVALGAKPFGGNGSLSAPAIYGIGEDSLLYFIDDQYRFENDFDFISPAPQASDIGLISLDHVTHNVFRGNMDKWANFYEDLFNFKEIRYFDIEGKATGLFSRAMTSPCAKIRIPINESADDQSQIEEYLKLYNGEGIQHIAMSTNNIYETVEKLRDNGIRFMTIPDTYYRQVNDRLPWQKEPLERLEKNRIIIDGAPTEDGGLLLQIFTDTVIGPIFFEIIQRKGDEGFGEGNFKALFESIELDQFERGVIKS